MKDPRENGSVLPGTVRALGIDLGTTNSAAAEVIWDRDGGSPPEVRVLEIEQPTREGSYTSPLVPSVAAILPDNTVWIGEGAKRLRACLAEYGLSFEKNLFYDTKNEMGLRKTYYRAPEPFNHASKIAGKVLGFIAGEAVKGGAGADHVSVTVPASFQLNQRRDTVRAAALAGLSVRDDDILDEPTAVLIDHLVGQRAVPAPGPSREGSAGDPSVDEIPRPGDRPLLGVVFDFGGGTCDVSVIEMSRGRESENDRASSRLPEGLTGLAMSQLSVSRYHRLGGGDIDAAIVHEILIPRLLAENHLSPLDITFAKKKKGLEPQLLGKAEALKIALCREVDRLRKFGQYSAATDKSSIVVHQPSQTCSLGSTALTLTDPSMSAAEFELVLTPFLDTEYLFARVTEYHMSQSIFAPLRDALDRAGREPSDVDFCLMAGGSSFIPQIRDAVRSFFPRAHHVFHGDGLESKLCVARGAAWNAAFKAVTGGQLIQPVLHEGIVLIADGGRKTTLIPSKQPLPFPEDGSFLRETLVVPPSAAPVGELRFEIVGELDGQKIFDEVWRLPGPVEPGTRISFEYRITRGKQFDCRACLTSDPSVSAAISIENPLVNIADPNAVQVRIEEEEEKLRAHHGATAGDRDSYVRLARMYSDMNQKEKALDYLRSAQVRVSRPDPEILLLQGVYFSELGDNDRAVKAYTEADRLAPLWGAPLFNLALLYRKQGRHQEALDTVEKALQRVGDPGPYLALKALAVDSLGMREGSRQAAEKALLVFGPPSTLDDWSLGWLLTAARVAGNEDAAKRAEEELRKRERPVRAGRDQDDVLRPAIVNDDDIPVKPAPKQAGGKKPRR